jgi:hypothetical protein
MNRTFLLLISAAVALFPGPISVATADDAAKVKKIFADPPREYSSGPLWTWNDNLTEQHIRLTMRDLASQKVKQVWVHPRPGLLTPYLSPEWFRLWKIALDEAEKLDMNVWIYDENSYPSGFAGGLVPEAMPESRGRGLVFTEHEQPARPGKDVVAVYSITADGCKNVTTAARSDKPLPKGRYLVARVRRARSSKWFAGKYYVDLLMPGVTEKFLEITMEAYRREIGEQFGKRVPGVFTDEPQIHPAGGLPWTDHLPKAFKKRWGYSLLDHLPSLTRPVGDWRRVRHNYFQVLMEQFIHRWAKPFYEYCAKHNLEFTGHYWEHSWPNCRGVPDNMALAAWQHRPGIDILFNRYGEGTHAQFGNVRSVKELGSVANQLGRKRTISETFGGSGWDMRLEDIKRQTDWQYALGLNTLNECLSFITIRGVRKGDYPQSLSYHEPWWEAYHVLAGYFTRLSVAMSHGKQVNPTLVIEPTTTAWMYQRGRELGPLGDTFQQIVTKLAKDQVEFDIGSEYIMAQHGSVKAKQLVVGKARYDTVVLPPLTENLNQATIKLLKAYLQGGGTVLCCGKPPSRVDGKASPEGQSLAKLGGWKQVEASALTGILRGRVTDGFAVRRKAGDKGILYSLRRQLDDGDLLFLANTSITHATRGTIESKARGVQRWVAETGKQEAYPFKQTASGTAAEFDLPPVGSLLLFLSKTPIRPAPVRKTETKSISPTGPTQVKRIAPNVLVVDYLDVTAGKETKKSINNYRATAFAFAANGMKFNPAMAAIQFRDEYLSMKFPKESGFTATYRFKIEKRLPRRLQVVVEMANHYSITCNGRQVKPIKGAWFIDRAWGKIDISSAARVGENTITLKASPFSLYHELEPIYVLGDFSVQPVSAGFVIRPPTPLKLGQQSMRHTTSVEGTMWLSGGIGFEPQHAKDRKDDGDPYLIFDLGDRCNLEQIRVFNYNQTDWTKLGVKRLTITGSATGAPDSFDVKIGTFEVKAAGSAAMPFETLAAKASDVRFVKFDILSNHNGVTYPTTEARRHFSMVGLSEVQFFGRSPGQDTSGQIDNVSVAKFSSELAARRDRRAAYLVDGSGLQIKGTGGWNRQGCPFYSAGVAYRQEFNISEKSGRYYVELPAWYGSVARVTVNDKPVGYIAYRPWKCEVTERIKPGANRVEVVVIGTLKNTLGPFHGRNSLGFVGPHTYRAAPPTGPPAGKSYQTIDYGLFAPFKLKHRTP